MRKTAIFFLLLIVIGSVIPIPFGRADGENWLAGWLYRKQHTLTGSVDGIQTNYQVGIKVYYGNGVDGTEVVTGITFGKVYMDSMCDTDFGDIRFTASDGDTELDYWIESQTDSNNAIIWVENPSIAASPDTFNIYIYCGAVAADTTSSGKATFPNLFDHFLGPSLNLTVFQVDASDGSVSFADSIIRIQGNAGNNRYSFASKAPFTTADPSALRFRGLIEKTTVSYQIIQVGWARWGITGFAIFQTQANAERAYTRDSLGNPEQDPIGDENFDAYFTYEITRGGGLAGYRVDGTLVATGDFNPDSDNIGIQTYVRDSERDLYLDWCLIREYTPNEPTHGAWGSWESSVIPPLDPTCLFGAGFNSSTPYAELHWNHSLEKVEFFEIQNSSDAISWDYLGSSTTANYTDWEVFNGTARYYKVRACNFTSGAWFNSSFSHPDFEIVYFIKEIGNGDGALIIESDAPWIALAIILSIIAFLLATRIRR